MPFPEDVKQGVITARIAAYIGDMVKLKKRDRDKEMSIARRDLDWHKQFDLAIAKDEAVRIRSERQPSAEDSCTMCGQFCASRILKGMFDDEIRNGGKC